MGQGDPGQQHQGRIGPTSPQVTNGSYWANRVAATGRQRPHSFRRRPAALQRIADLQAPVPASVYEAASHSSVSRTGSPPRAGSRGCLHQLPLVGHCCRWLCVKWVTGFDLGPAIAQKLDRMAAFQYDECVLTAITRLSRLLFNFVTTVFQPAAMGFRSGPRKSPGDFWKLRQR
jgi:hypothetical protein